MHFLLIGATVEVYAIKDTIDALLTHVFNDVIHPDFTRIPSLEKPALRFHALETYKPCAIDGYTILASCSSSIAGHRTSGVPRRPGQAMTPALLKPELMEFRRQKGYLPHVILVHMAPPLETEIREEAAELARELHARIDLGYEGMEIGVQENVSAVGMTKEEFAKYCQ